MDMQAGGGNLPSGSPLYWGIIKMENNGVFNIMAINDAILWNCSLPFHGKLRTSNNAVFIVNFTMNSSSALVDECFRYLQ